MNSAPGDSTLPPPNDGLLVQPPPDERWSNRRFILIISLALLAHVALIYLTGTKKPVRVRPVTDAPRLQLADRGNELIALDDPTLFARPNLHDVVSLFWRQLPPVELPSFSRPEPPHYLEASPQAFGSAFHEFVEASSQPANFQMNFKPDPVVITPDVTMDNPVPADTTVRFSDELARRGLPLPLAAPALPYNDVIGPTTVQLLVNPDGNVISCVVLNSSRYAKADQTALNLARQLHFAPAAQLMFGEVTFNWRTESTNSIPAKPTP